MNWDETDWIKAFGYGAAVLALVFSVAGDKRTAATLRGVSTVSGLLAGVVDLVEAPKHCGKRAILDRQLNCYVCSVCGNRVAHEPKFGFD